MKKLLLVLPFVLLTLLIPSANALQLEDGLYFTMPPDDIKCIDIVLPDVMGVFGMGKVEYELTSTADRSWADITEENIVRTDENNTVIFPMCFYSFGRQEGQCSEPYVITISAPSLQLEKHWSGGVCISEFVDVDIVDGDSETGDETSWDSINSNADLFDIGFEEPVVYSEPGGAVNYELLLESYADITLDLVVQPTGLTINPWQRTVVLSSSNPRDSVNFTVDVPPQTGRYNVTIKAQMRDCESMGLCVKLAKGELIVSDSVPVNEGFSVSLFPKNINVKDLNPVLFSLTIQNGDKARAFDMSIVMPEGLTSTFEPETINLDADEKRVISFTVTPSGASSFYEIKLTATSEGNAKQATSFLSTNEMLTDSVRDANSIEADQQTLDNVNNELDSWIERYRRSGYGEGLDDYQNLRNTFSDARETGGTQDNGWQINGGNGDETGNGSIFDNIWLIAAVIIIVVAALMFLIYSKKSRKSVLEREI